MFGDKFTPRSRVFVKICGITNEADARAAIDSGADALGFNLVRQSKRYIAIESAAAWIGKLPDEICKVAVMANPTREQAIRISELPFIDALQLHGNESAQLCCDLAKAGINFVKAVPVSDSNSLSDMPNFSTDTLILDTVSGGEFGGTGKTFSWKIALQFAQANPDAKVILAGGLSPSNVGKAIEQARPFGVDVTSGVETSPGQKDASLVRAFIKAAWKASATAA